MINCGQCRYDFPRGANTCAHCGGHVDYGGDLKTAGYIVMLTAIAMLFATYGFVMPMLNRGNATGPVLLLFSPGIALAVWYFRATRNRVTVTKFRPR